MNTGFKKVMCVVCAQRLFDLEVANIDANLLSDCFVMIKCGKCKQVMLINLTDRKVIKREQ